MATAAIEDKECSRFWPIRIKGRVSVKGGPVGSREIGDHMKPLSNVA